MSKVEGLLANDTDPDNDPLKAILVSPPSNGSLTLANDGSFTYKPNENFYGSDSFTYKANDGNYDSNVAKVSITVKAVNDPPSFTKGANQEVLEDSDVTEVTGWATNISAGPQESNQTVTFNVTTDKPSLFEQEPSIDPTGKLIFKPAADANGIATVTVIAQDDGGTENGGKDTSDPQTFTIKVIAVNDPPSFTKGDDENVEEDSGKHTVTGWATDISAGPEDEADQTLNFIVTTDNDSLRLEDANAPFTDVDSSAWYAAAVHTAYVHQLINGYEDGSFRPNEKITREQAMAIIARAMRITGLAGKLTQVDAEDVLRGYADIGRASKWALDSIAENVQAGIVTGRDAITLAPQAHITRAEAAVMIQRLLRYSDLI